MAAISFAALLATLPSLAPAGRVISVRTPRARMMGGETGLPLAPARVWRLIGREYDEVTARFWQALVITFIPSSDGTASFGGRGILDKAAQNRAFEAAQKAPSLLDPLVADRFAFAAIKRSLVSALGSEAAALDVLSKDPTLLMDASRLDGKTPAQIKAAANAKQLMSGTSPALLLLLAVAVCAVGAGSSPNDLLSTR